MATTPHDDVDAVKRVLAGDTEAFDVLVRRHQDHLFRVLSRHLPRAEVPEVAQEAFVAAFLGLSGLRDPVRFRSWLCAIALKRSADYWRENARRGERSVDFSDPRDLAWMEDVLSSDSTEGYEELATRREAEKLVELLMAEVSAEDRLALELYYSEEYTVAEIADMLGWGESKVKVRMHRARKKMAAKARTLVGREGERT